MRRLIIKANEIKPSFGFLFQILANTQYNGTIGIAYLCTLATMLKNSNNIK